MGCHQPIADIGDYAPGGEMFWCGVNFPRDLKCQILSSLIVEIAFKRRKQANMRTLHAKRGLMDFLENRESYLEYSRL